MTKDINTPHRHAIPEVGCLRHQQIQGECSCLQCGHYLSSQKKMKVLGEPIFLHTTTNIIDCASNRLGLALLIIIMLIGLLIGFSHLLVFCN